MCSVFTGALSLVSYQPVSDQLLLAKLHVVKILSVAFEIE